MKTTIQIKGVDCKSCKAVIEDVCKDIPGVKKCTVDFKTGKAVVEYSDVLDWKVLKKEIESLGDYKIIL